MPRKAKVVKRDEVLNQMELAARLDLDPRQIRNLHKRGMPKTYLHESGSEPGYAWPACLHWYLRYKVEAETQKLAMPQRMANAQIREIEAKASKAELTLAKERGELMERSLVGRERQQAFERIRNMNTTRASRWAPQLEGLSGNLLLTKLEDLAEQEMAQLQRSLLGISTYEDALRDFAEDEPDDDVRPPDA